MPVTPLKKIMHIRLHIILAPKMTPIPWKMLLLSESAPIFNGP